MIGENDGSLRILWRLPMKEFAIFQRRKSKGEHRKPEIAPMALSLINFVKHVSSVTCPSPRNKNLLPLLHHLQGLIKEGCLCLHGSYEWKGRAVLDSALCRLPPIHYPIISSTLNAVFELCTHLSVAPSVPFSEITVSFKDVRQSPWSHGGITCKSLLRNHIHMPKQNLSLWPLCCVSIPFFPCPKPQGYLRGRLPISCYLIFHTPPDPLKFRLKGIGKQAKTALQKLPLRRPQHSNLLWYRRRFAERNNIGSKSAQIWFFSEILSKCVCGEMAVYFWI